MSKGFGWLQFGGLALGAYVVGWLAFVGVVGYVIVHFLAKFW